MREAFHPSWNVALRDPAVAENDRRMAGFAKMVLATGEDPHPLLQRALDQIGLGRARDAMEVEELVLELVDIVLVVDTSLMNVSISAGRQGLRSADVSQAWYVDLRLDLRE